MHPMRWKACFTWSSFVDHSLQRNSHPSHCNGRVPPVFNLVRHIPKQVPKAWAAQMNKNDQTPLMEKREEQIRKWEDPFMKLMDDIYWTGYAKDLQKKNLEEYVHAIFDFIIMYD